MNEYVYEVWISERMGSNNWPEFEFDHLEIIAAYAGLTALAAAHKEWKDDKDVRYQIRGLKKL